MFHMECYQLGHKQERYILTPYGDVSLAGVRSANRMVARRGPMLYIPIIPCPISHVNFQFAVDLV